MAPALPACLKTHHSLLVWVAGVSGVPRIRHWRSSMRSRLDGPGFLFLAGPFRCPDFEPLHPALTAVFLAFSPYLRRLCLLRRGLLLLSLASDMPGLLVVLLLRANQLSSPAQKRVISVVRAAMDFGFSWPRCRASHSSRMLCLKAARASASGQSTIWFFLVRNLVRNFLANCPAC